MSDTTLRALVEMTYPTLRYSYRLGGTLIFYPVGQQFRGPCYALVRHNADRWILSQVS
jgi:hypothetical protein